MQRVHLTISAILATGGTPNKNISFWLYSWLSIPQHELCQAMSEIEEKNQKRINKHKAKTQQRSAIRREEKSSGKSIKSSQSEARGLHKKQENKATVSKNQTKMAEYNYSEQK